MFVPLKLKGSISCLDFSLPFPQAKKAKHQPKHAAKNGLSRAVHEGKDVWPK